MCVWLRSCVVLVLVSQALCCFRIAAISYGVFARGLAGNAGSTNVHTPPYKIKAHTNTKPPLSLHMTRTTHMIASLQPVLWQALLSGVIANNLVDIGLGMLEKQPRPKL